MTQRSCGFTLDLFEASRCEPSDSTLEVETYREPALLTPSAVFRHPRATRELMLGTVQVAYEVRRGKRRTIGFTVGPEGLAVSAPPWVSLRDIDQAVQDKSRWVLKKLQETQAKSQRLARAQTMWADGCQLLFLGRPVTVALDMRESVGASGALLEPGREGATPRLIVHLPQTASAAQIKSVVQAWLMRQATRLFTERLDHFAPTVGVCWRKLSLSSAHTRWGSARSDGSIRLNWRLLQFRQPIIDYVVVHELSHLRVMDHSPRFWSVVGAVVPDYATLRRQLRDDGSPHW